MRIPNNPSSLCLLLIVVSDLLDHELKLLLVLFELTLQVLYVFVLIVDCSLEATHGQEELLDLEA